MARGPLRHTNVIPNSKKATKDKHRKHKREAEAVDQVGAYYQGDSRTVAASAQNAKDVLVNELVKDEMLGEVGVFVSAEDEELDEDGPFVSANKKDEDKKDANDDIGTEIPAKKSKLPDEIAPVAPATIVQEVTGVHGGSKDDVDFDYLFFDDGSLELLVGAEGEDQSAAPLAAKVVAVPSLSLSIPDDVSEYPVVVAQSQGVND